MTEERIREIARHEIRSYDDFGARHSKLLGESMYNVKQDLKQFCELKIENEVGKKLEGQRMDIFQTLRIMAKTDPIVSRNIEDITANFFRQFTMHCDTEILNVKRNL